MAIEYRIKLQARTASGFDTFGEFFIGNDRQAAKDLFNTLKGSPDELEEALLLMELVEIDRNLPLDIQILHCTLDEMAYNCRLITKDQFKILNLKVLGP